MDNAIKLENFWPYQAVVLGDLISRHTLSILKTQGELNLSQWRVLAAIADTPGRSSAQVVAVTPMDKGLVSRAVKSLLESSHIRKENDPSDKRKSALYLTRKGETLYAEISALQIKAIADYSVKNTPDSAMIDILNDRIKAVRAGLKT
ncbi:MarR family winged helix-turn-helix transcriptional regulator [Robiginitomaculum antarcticum]|uniref:MarR family winged helix-turn-helix transcriptional regulator n=1 Tax=Robiginitomaculum antarcticum TaxID=437507 RepID=UPI00037CE140|nr:MarR family winged helix-turn-helix transcriptional regulator [Robiginitomaculum antarcticum]